MKRLINLPFLAIAIVSSSAIAIGDSNSLPGLKPSTFSFQGFSNGYTVPEVVPIPTDDLDPDYVYNSTTNFWIKKHGLKRGKSASFLVLHNTLSQKVTVEVEDVEHAPSRPPVLDAFPFTTSKGEGGATKVLNLLADTADEAKKIAATDRVEMGPGGKDSKPGLNKQRSMFYLSLIDGWKAEAAKFLKKQPILREAAGLKKEAAKIEKDIEVINQKISDLHTEINRIGEQNPTKSKELQDEVKSKEADIELKKARADSKITKAKELEDFAQSPDVFSSTEADDAKGVQVANYLANLSNEGRKEVLGTSVPTQAGALRAELSTAFSEAEKAERYLRALAAGMHLRGAVYRYEPQGDELKITVTITEKKGDTTPTDPDGFGEEGDNKGEKEATAKKTVISAGGTSQHLPVSFGFFESIKPSYSIGFLRSDLQDDSVIATSNGAGKFTLSQGIKHGPQLKPIALMHLSVLKNDSFLMGPAFGATVGSDGKGIGLVAGWSLTTGRADRLSLNFLWEFSSVARLNGHAFGDLVDSDQNLTKSVTRNKLTIGITYMFPGAVKQTTTGKAADEVKKTEDVKAKAAAEKTKADAEKAKADAEKAKADTEKAKKDGGGG